MPPSSYSQFKQLDDVKNNFPIQIDEKLPLFRGVAAYPVSAYLQTTLDRNIFLATAINTEKARSEMIVAPMLIELVQLLNHEISLFSGIDFNVDETKGLKGRCDFLISQSAEQYQLTAPVMTVVEAKNDNLNTGLAQCIATMIGGQLFNQQKKHNLKAIYGAVTIGTAWRFLKLQDTQIWIDRDEYYVNQADQILGILVHITQETK